MNLTGIIAISGKPGLYKVVAQGKNNIIVESLADNKRVPAYATDRISALEDISIYTYNDDKPLKEVYKAIFTKENGGLAPSPKSDLNELKSYLLEILPDYDDERVYSSDIKKLFQWYNLLHKSGNLKLEEEASEESVEEKPAKKAPAKKEAKPKTTAKATTKATDKKATAKKAPAKKAQTKKASSSK